MANPTVGGNEAWLELVERCADAIYAVARSFVELQTEYGEIPLAGSPFNDDLEDTKARHGLLHARCEDIGYVISAKALLGFGQLYAVADCLRGAGALVGPWTLFRPVIETLGYVRWILDSDTVEGRIRRTMTERLHGLYETRKIGNELGAADIVEAADRDIESLINDAESLDFEVERPDRRAPYVGGQRQNAVTVSGLLFNDAQDGGLLYRQASGYVHGMVAAAESHLMAEGDAPEANDRYRTPSSGPQEIAVITRLAIAAGIFGLGPVYSYFGYAGTTWHDRASDAIGRTNAIMAELQIEAPLPEPDG